MGHVCPVKSVRIYDLWIERSEEKIYWGYQLRLKRFTLPATWGRVFLLIQSPFFGGGLTPRVFFLHLLFLNLFISWVWLLSYFTFLLTTSDRSMTHSQRLNKQEKQEKDTDLTRPQPSSSAAYVVSPLLFSSHLTPFPSDGHSPSLGLHLSRQPQST